MPPELVFDQGFGDLFVLRLAGNVYVPSVAGSIQYAHLHLGVALLVVLGHEGCGAVSAALGCKIDRAEQPEHIQGLVRLIEPGLKEIDAGLPAATLLQMAVEANVPLDREADRRDAGGSARPPRQAEHPYRRRGV